MRCGEWTETRIIGPIAKAKPKGRISAFYRLALLFPRRDQPSRTRREGTTLRCAGDGEWKAVFTQETEIFKL